MKALSLFSTAFKYCSCFMNTMNIKHLILILVLSAMIVNANMGSITVSFDETYLTQLFGSMLEPSEIEGLSNELELMDESFKEKLIEGLNSDNADELKLHIIDYLHYSKIPKIISNNELYGIQKSNDDLEKILNDLID
jgi:hypothetical protein